MSDSGVIALPETREEQTTKLLPPYHVILANDDHHSMEFVIEVLVKVFGYKLERCVQLMLEAVLGRERARTETGDVVRHRHLLAVIVGGRVNDLVVHGVN